MAFDPLTAILNIGGKVLDKVLPDPEAKRKAQLELARMEMDGELEEMKTQMSVMLAEAQSLDKWTSRARPSFLYVIYIYIIAAIPFGIISVWHPDIVNQVAIGMTAWLKAIPDQLWYLFGVGYLGYVGARSWDKSKLFNGK